MHREREAARCVWQRVVLTLISLAIASATSSAAELDGIKFLGDETDRNVGIFVGGNGDFNADGVDDVIIAAWKTASAPTGRVYVVYGGQPIAPDFRLGDLLNGDGSQGVVLTPDPTRTRDRFGRSADFLGDINGDGIDDIIVGSIYSGRTGVGELPYDAGEAYVIFGRAGGLPGEYSVEALFEANGGDGSEGFVIRGFRRQDELGRSVSRAGDVNGDGIADLIVGALVDTYIYDDPTPGEGPGEAYVIFGRADGSFPAQIDVEAMVNEGDGTDGFVLRGVKNLDRMGVVAEAGDVDGDGVDDLVLGALSGGVGVAGEAYVVYGRSTGFPGIFELSTLLPSNGASGSEGFVVVGSQPGDRLGLVHGAGDVNGDGFDDVLLGAYRAAPLGIAETGVAYLLLGRTRTLRGPAFDLRTLFPDNGGDGTAGTVIPGSDAGDRLASVSTAGNVNADEYDDFIVGSFRGEEGEASPDGDVGEAYLIFGRETFPPIFFLNRLRAEDGADGSSGAIIIGEDVDGRQGRALSEAGDFDADGYDDIVTGAWQADGEGNNRPDDDAGEAYVTYGRDGLMPASVRVSVFDDPFANPIVGACAGLGATLYDDDGYTVPLATLAVGVYDILAPSLDDHASAITIAPGLRVSLYRDVDTLDAPDLVLTEDQVLTGEDDNAVSAVLVECIDVTGAPSVVDPGDQRGAVGELVDVAIAVEGDVGAPYTFAATGLPPVLVIGRASGEINGLLTTAGEYPVEVEVTSAYGGSSRVAFEWVVTDPQGNVPPTLVDPGDQVTEVGSPVSLQLQGADADGDTLTYSALPLPQGLSLDPATGIISGAPLEVQQVAVVAAVDDGRGGTASVEFQWSVEPRSNTPPTLEDPGPQSTEEGTKVALPMVAKDVDGDVLTFAASGLPLGLTIDPALGLISGTPTQAQLNEVTVSVEDGRQGTASVTFSWTVEERNVPPTLDNPGDQSSVAGDAVSLPLIANDANGDTLSFSAERLPQGLEIDRLTGVISGTPTQVQTAEVTATVDDGRGGVASVSFAWQIEERNLPPTLNDPGTQLTVEGTPVSLGLVASDPNGDVLTFSVTGLPAGLVLNAESGVISGTPTLPQVAVVVATVDDGRGGRASVTFDWIVEQSNTIPTLENPGAQTTIIGTAVALALVANDSDGDALRYSATGLPTGLAIDPVTGVIDGIPTQVESTAVTATVDDGRGGLASVSFEWSIEPEPNQAPTLEDPGAQLGRVGEAGTLQLMGADADGDTLSYGAQGLPDGLTVDPATGLISGVAQAAQVRAVTATVEDGRGASASVSFDWTIEDAFDERLETAPFSIPGGGGRSTQVVDLSALGVAPGELVRVSDVRALGDLNDGGETFRLDFNDGSLVALPMSTGQECNGRLDGVLPALSTWIAVLDLGGGVPGIRIEGSTSGEAGALCEPLAGGADVAVQYVLQIARGNALRAPVRELPADGGSTVHFVALSPLGIAVGDPVEMSDVRAQGDLDSDAEFFSLSFNNGLGRADDLEVIEQCTGFLEPVTVPVSSTVQAIDFGAGKPGVRITGTTQSAVGALCEPVGSGSDIAVQYSVVVAPTDSLRSSLAVLPEDGGSGSFTVDLSGLGVAVNDRVDIVSVRARGDLDGDNESFSLSFNGDQVLLQDLTVPSECVGLEEVTSAVAAELIVEDLGGGVPGVRVTGTTSGAVDDLCVATRGTDQIGLEVIIELRR